MDTIDLCLHNAQKEIAELVRRMKESPEVCPDEEDADKAIQDALDNFFRKRFIKAKTNRRCLMSEAAEAVSTEIEDLKPKKLTNKAQQGMTPLLFVAKAMKRAFQVKVLLLKAVCSPQDTLLFTGSHQHHAEASLSLIILMTLSRFTLVHTQLTAQLSPMMMGDRLFIQQQAR